MLFTSRAEICIRVLVHLAQREPGEWVRISDVARAEGLPLPYLAKQCQDLAKLGFIETVRGRRGGIRLAQKPEALRLQAVLEGLREATGFQRCILGFLECSDRVPCPLHDTWKPLRAVLLDSLGSKSLADLAQAAQKKRRSGNGPWHPGAEDIKI